MRKALFVLMVAASMMVLGCGEKKDTPPPAGADTAETPDVDIDPGIEAPGEGTTTDEGTTEEGTKEGEE